MKRIFIILSIFSIIFVFYLNSNYPFFIYQSSGWSIGFNQVKNPIKSINVQKENIFTYDSLNSITNRTRFLADPFLYYNCGKYFIFFEHQPVKGPATIAYLESIDGMNYSYKGEVLNKEYHLSFPQVFEQNERIYMLPEAAASNQVLLFEAKNFPSEWKIRDTLIKDFKLKDPAILLTDTLNIIVGVDQDHMQRVFKSDSLLGRWQEFTKFKTGIGDEIRPAGNFFLYKKNYYIPLQNNSHGYGSSVSLYKLTSNSSNLNLKKEEQLILEKKDSIIWFNRGMHHLNVNSIGDDNFYVVYDGDRKIEDEKKLNWKASLKYNFYEFIEQF